MEFSDIVVKESPGLCRCCLSEGCYKDLSSEYIWMNENEVYADMLLECFDISITQQSDGPNGSSRLICEVCITRLRDACNFKKQVLDSEKKFIDMIGRGEFRPKILIYQAPMKKEDDGELQLHEVEYLDEEADFDDNEEVLQVSQTGLDEATSAHGTVTAETLTLKRKLAKPRKGKVGRAKKQNTVDAEEKPRSSKAVSKEKMQERAKGPKTSDLDFDEEFNRPLIRVKQAMPMKRVKILRQNAVAVLKNSTLMPFRWLKNVYRCFYCYDMFEETKGLKLHQEQHANNDVVSKVMENYWESSVYVDATDITCKICVTKLKDVDALIDHLMEDHEVDYNKDVKTFNAFRLNLISVDCLECNQPFRSFGHLLMHTNRYHKGNSQSLCDTCGQYFKNTLELSRHKKFIHDKKSVTCNLCGEDVGNITRMRTHMQKFHNRKYKCFYCTELFPNHYKRSRHTMEVHGSKQKVKCTECELTFVYRSTMLRHVRESHLRERNETCALCGFKAFGKGRLAVHMKKHSDEREFPCTFCDKAFKTKKHLRQHVKNLHEKGNIERAAQN